MKKFASVALAVFLSLAVLVTFTPLLGGEAYAATKLKAPKLSAEVVDHDAVLSWSKVSKAKSYNVYQKVGSKYKKLATVKGTEYTAQNLPKDDVLFKVRACKTATGKTPGSYSAAVKVNVLRAFDAEEKLFLDAQDVYKVSDEATEEADKVARELAYNPEYWDSDEGWRTSGSDAEHRAAKYLKQEWKDIGLDDVSLDRVKVDKFQFNYANLQVTCDDESKNLDLGDDGTDITGGVEEESVISYAVSGTKQIIADKGLPEDYYQNLEIVDMGEGTEIDYLNYYAEHPEANNSMKGKVVLVKLDQVNIVWVTQPLAEAKAQGAEAIITYQYDGYAQYSDDTNHVQDVCCSDLQVPLLGISVNNAMKIQDAINAGNAKISLDVDAELKDNGGYAYNVVGTIKGTGNTGQRILYGGHYDKYFYGLEDDCAAIGLIAGIAKSYIDSGYRPVNDLVFVAHAAEEWGETGTDFDWAIASYKEITQVHPEWQGTTLAMLNFELPAIDRGAEQVINSSVETISTGDKIINSGILKDSAQDKYGYEYSTSYSPTAFVYADIVGYEEFGVPGHMNALDTMHNPWFSNRYHTQNDTVSEDETIFGKFYKGSPSKEGDGDYSTKLLNSQIDVYAAMGMAYDQAPAISLDFGARVDQLKEGADNLSVSASVKKDYKAAVDKLAKAAKANMKKGEQINADYAAACKRGDTAAAAKAKKMALSYNARTLKAFKQIQQKLVSIDLGGLYLDISHNLIQNNLTLYNDTCTTLKGLNGDEENDLAVAVEALYGNEETETGGVAMVNSWFEWCYGMKNSVGALDILQPIFTNDKENWGKCIQMKNGLEKTWYVSHDVNLYVEGYSDECDLKAAAAEYNNLLKLHKAQLKSTVVSETNAIKSIANGL